MVQSDEHMRDVVKLLTQMAINYVAYVFLAGTIILTLGAALFAYVSFFGNDFSFLSPFIGTGDITLGTNDVLNIYFVSALVLGAIINFFLFVLGKIARKKIEITPRTKKLAALLIVTVIFASALFAVPRASLLNSGDSVFFFLIFGIFYVISVLFLFFYFGIMWFSRIMH